MGNRVFCPWCLGARGFFILTINFKKMELTHDKIQRIVSYIKAKYPDENDIYFCYSDLRDSIRHAFDQKFTFTVSRKIINELDKKGVIIPVKIGWGNKVICWQLKE